MIEPRGLPAGEHLEVWVVGQPNPVQVSGLPGPQEFPPYRFQWTDALAEEFYGVATALEAARRFISCREIDSAEGREYWAEGPRIVIRTVVLGEWEEVE